MAGSPAPSIPDKVERATRLALGVRSLSRTIRLLFTFREWNLRAAYMLLVMGSEMRWVTWVLLWELMGWRYLVQMLHRVTDVATNRNLLELM